MDLQTVQKPRCGPSEMLTRVSGSLHMHSPGLPCETQTAAPLPGQCTIEKQKLSKA